MKKNLFMLACVACIWVCASCDETSTLVATSCPDNQHLNNDKICVDDTLEMCGESRLNCFKFIIGLKKGRCESGTCVAENCKDGYYVENLTCKLNQCKSGEHKVGDNCEPDDIDNCGREGWKCETSMPGFLDGRCENNTCIATKCAHEYELHNNSCVVPDQETMCDEDHYLNEGICVLNNMNHCGAHNNACKNKPGFKTGRCEKGSCIAESCLENYKLKDGECEFVSVVECHEDEYIHDGVCEPSDVDNCGAFQKSCVDEMPGFMTGKCENGSCIAESCLENYEFQNGSCLLLEENYSDNSCPDGEHDNNGNCEPDDEG